MKKKITAFALALILTVSVLALGGCTSNTVTQEQLADAIDRALKDSGKGDVYNVTINPSETPTGLLSASKGLLSTVSVYTTFTVWSYGSFSGKITTSKSTKAGAGVIYKLDKETGDAYIITNYHVVYEASATSEDCLAESIKLFVYGKETSNYAIPATFVGGSMYYDIAVLKVEGNEILRTSIAQAVTVADSNKISLLDTAIAIGNPESEGISVTVGHINVESEYVTMGLADEVSYADMRLIRTDTAINHGNSGGGLFNEQGELIGIVNAKTIAEEVENIGYAIPSNIATAVADSAIYYNDGSMYRCLLGITVTASASRAEYDTETGKVSIVETVKVDSITKNSLADGVIEAEDIIESITVDGKDYEVTRMFHVIDVMLNARVGSSVTVHVSRAGVKKDLDFTINESCLTKY